MSQQLTLSLWYELLATKPHYRVRIDAGDPLKEEQPTNLAICSLSPIFSVAEAPYIPSNTDSYAITFIANQKAFVELGSLSNDVKKYLWLSLGITSVIAICPEGVHFEDIQNLLSSSSTLCFEQWTIGNGNLIGDEVSYNGKQLADTPTPFDSPLPSNADIARVIHELYLNFDALLKRARVLMPSLIPTIEHMLKSTNAKVKDIVAGESRLSTLTKNGDAIASKSDEYLTTYKSGNLSVDELVQLNSALAYILSQSFYGGPPLKQNLSLISCHALLGIGTAIKAIQRLTEFIINGFEKHPLAMAVKTSYPTTTLKKCLTDGLTPDDFLNQGQNAEQVPKLAYFSSRMGFSEQGYCVTAAIQCLSSADEAKRSLLTLTHELLHSHVKGIFAAVFSSSSMPSSNDSHSFLGYVREYKKLWTELAANKSAVENWDLSMFLRYRIFSFSDGIYKIVTDHPDCRIDNTPGAKNIPVEPDADDNAELNRFRNAYDFLNELLVHVLDFHYFYDTSDRLYLSTLWKSWAYIPGVSHKIEWYILRCLVAISVGNMTGLCKEDFPNIKDIKNPTQHKLHNRFNDAISSLYGVLEELCKDKDHGPMLDIVLQKLKDEAVKNWLREAFFPSHLFAQVAKQFLYSPKLKQYFEDFSDPLADRNEQNQPVYQLNAFDFTISPVKNPIALLQDRLLRELEGEKSSTEEARSAWLFLALASLEPHG